MSSWHTDSGLALLVATGEARRLRKDAGIGLATMAEAFGVSGATLGNLERGVAVPGIGLGRKWLRVLNGLAWHETAGAIARGKNAPEISAAPLPETCECGRKLRPGWTCTTCYAEGTEAASA